MEGQGGSLSGSKAPTATDGCRCSHGDGDGLQAMLNGQCRSRDTSTTEKGVQPID